MRAISRRISILVRMELSIHHNIVTLAKRNERSVNEEIVTALRAWGNRGLRNDITDITDSTDIEKVLGAEAGICQTCHRSSMVSEPCRACGAQLCGICYREEHCLACEIGSQKIPF